MLPWIIPHLAYFRLRLSYTVTTDNYVSKHKMCIDRSDIHYTFNIIFPKKEWNRGMHFSQSKNALLPNFQMSVIHRSEAVSRELSGPGGFSIRQFFVQVSQPHWTHFNQTCRRFGKIKIFILFLLLDRLDLAETSLKGHSLEM